MKAEIQAARAALTAWYRDCRGSNAKTLADATEALVLACEQPLSAEDRATVERFRTEYGTVAGTLWKGVQAIIDRLAPKPVPAKGDRVKWWRGEDTGTGTYIGPGEPPWFYPHDVKIHGDVTLGVDRVEPLDGGAR